MPRPTVGERAMSNAERQRRHRERLRANRPPAPDYRQLLADTQLEIERLRQAAAQPAKPAKPVTPAKPIDPDSEVARLKTANRNLRIKIAAMAEHAELERTRKGIMPYKDYAAIVRCLHPDQTPTQEQRQEAFGLMSRWWQADKKLPRG